jgi:hypothetical protein
MHKNFFFHENCQPVKMVEVIVMGYDIVFDLFIICKGNFAFIQMEIFSLAFSLDLVCDFYVSVLSW